MRYPDDSHVIFIMGHKGTGKTQEGLSQLSQRSFDEKPWILLDFKHNDLVAQMPVNGIVSVHEHPPAEPGLWCAKVTLEDARKGGPLEQYFHRCLRQGNTGLFVDEGRRIGGANDGFRAVIAEGRSQKVPVIFVCQRPVHVDTWCMSEADFFQVFNLVHPDDHARVWGVIPPNRLDFPTLRGAGKHHSFYYDVELDKLELIEPCDPFQVIYDRTLTRLPVFQDGAAPGSPPARRYRL
jgi:hypothetical protein